MYNTRVCALSDVPVEVDGHWAQLEEIAMYVVESSKAACKIHECAL